MLLAAQDAVEWQQRGLVTSGITFARNFGGALGVGLLGTLFNLAERREIAGDFGREFFNGGFAESA